MLLLLLLLVVKCKYEVTVTDAVGTKAPVEAKRVESKARWNERTMMIMMMMMIYY